MNDHLVIPDTQTKASAPTSHLEAAGRYALEHRPQWLVHLGDHFDFESLSVYDSPTKKAEEKRRLVRDPELGDVVNGDIDAGVAGFEAFNKPIDKWNKSHPRPKQYHPRRAIVLGNHENRLWKFLAENPWLRGLVSTKTILDICKQYGWKPYPFLKPVEVDGVAYCHFFPRASNGGVLQDRRGAPSARAQVQREGRSCTAGHKQGLDTCALETGVGIRRGVIAGSFYQHDESYKGPQGQGHWRGIIHKLGVSKGNYDLCEVSMGYLMRHYT